MYAKTGVTWLECLYLLIVGAMFGAFVALQIKYVIA